MDQVKDLIPTSEQTPTSSRNQQTSIATIPAEQHAALFALINKARMLNGWMSKTAKELDPMIRQWADEFNRLGIPISAYPELFSRAFDTRISAMNRGDSCPTMDAPLLASCWVGENGLKKELKRRAVEARNALPANAESVCQMCFGSGFKTVQDGRYSVSKKCDHGNPELQF
jgi:hypothetical protein